MLSRNLVREAGIERRDPAFSTEAVAAEEAVTERFLMRADPDRLVAEAAATDVLAVKP